MAIEKIYDRSHHYFLGEDKILEGTIYAADGVTPMNITGWEIWFVLRDVIGGEALLTKKTTDVSNGITITNGPLGLLEIAFADTDTDEAAILVKNWRAGTAYPYSVKRMTDGAEQILTFGTLTFAGTTQR